MIKAIQILSMEADLEMWMTQIWLIMENMLTVPCTRLSLNVHLKLHLYFVVG